MSSAGIASQKEENQCSLINTAHVKGAVNLK